MGQRYRLVPQIDHQGHRVARVAFPRGGIAHMPDRDIALQPLYDFIVKYFLHQTHIFMVLNGSLPVNRDSRAFLPSVLQGMQSEIYAAGNIFFPRRVYSDDAAFVMKFFFYPLH